MVTERGREIEEHGPDKEGSSRGPVNRASNPDGVDIVAEIRRLQSRLYDLQKRIEPDDIEEEMPDGDLTAVITRIGADRAAFFHDSLEEVVPMAALTPIPESPPWIAGMLNLRGKTIPVIDVYARIQRRSREQKISDFIVICSVDSRNVGLVVQEIDDVIPNARGNLEPRPTDVAFAPYVIRLLRHNDASIPVLSIPRLVATSNIPEEEP
jgi:purine-binding chemotaxis protein CheW